VKQKSKPFKKPPSRYVPQGIKILFEDRDIIVVNKQSGLLTVASDKEKHKNVLYMLAEYVRKGDDKSMNRVFTVHRLDRDTSGVVIFAKSKEVKEKLQENWSEFKKSYIAVVKGTMREKEGIIKTYLAENKIHRMYSVRDSKLGQLAITGYKVIKEGTFYSMLEVDLKTGKKNQIRVHLSEMGNPVAGDKKYGEKEKGVKRLALHAQSLMIQHPHNGEEMTFEAGLPGFFNDLTEISEMEDGPAPVKHVETPRDTHKRSKKPEYKVSEKKNRKNLTPWNGMTKAVEHKAASSRPRKIKSNKR